MRVKLNRNTSDISQPNSLDSSLSISLFLAPLLNVLLVPSKRISKQRKRNKHIETHAEPFRSARVTSRHGTHVLFTKVICIHIVRVLLLPLLSPLPSCTLHCYQLKLDGPYNHEISITTWECWFFQDVSIS